MRSMVLAGVALLISGGAMAETVTMCFNLGTVVYCRTSGPDDQPPMASNEPQKPDWYHPQRRDWFVPDAQRKQ